MYEGRKETEKNEPDSLDKKEHFKEGSVFLLLNAIRNHQILDLRNKVSIIFFI